MFEALFSHRCPPIRVPILTEEPGAESHSKEAEKAGLEPADFGVPIAPAEHQNFAYNKV
jgi:hypothetical protein